MNVQLPVHLDKPTFLSWVQGREERYELVDGRVVMMPGTSRDHGMIVGNLYVELRRQLDRSKWSVIAEFGLDSGPDTLRYPDIVIDRVNGAGKDYTATEPALGFGKYTVGPAIATARFLPRLESFLIGLLSYQTSVGGDPSRKDVSILNITAQVNSFWGQRWWTIVQSVWQVDFERSGKSSMVMEFEGGRNLIGRFGAYVRPGVGIYGRDVTGAYIWNIEVGVRYMFASF